MPEDLSPTRFDIHRTTLSTGATLAYLRMTMESAAEFAIRC